MPWVRIDENAMGHPKIEALSDGAFRLWVRGLSYCQKFLTDGYICRAALTTMRGMTRPRVEELLKPIESGTNSLWTQDGDGFRVHDYLTWNESREQVITARKYAKERLDRYRMKRVANVVTNADETIDTPPPPPPPPTKDLKPLADGFEVFWMSYPRKVAKESARKAWKKLKPDDALQQQMLDAVQGQRNSEAWLKDSGQFIPYPATWLNQRRWEDESIPFRRPRGPQVLIPKPDRVDWGTECDELHGGTCGNQSAHDLVMQRQKVSA